MEINIKNKQVDVCIMLSAFNGEEYILEQLESINNQRNVSVICYIRDDGSNDNTKDIIKGYVYQHSNFKLIEGNNIGVNRSFAELLSIVPNDYEFYAFSDQDDIWLPNKLNQAIEKLSHIEKGIPALYCSNLTALFKNGKKIDVWRSMKLMGKKSLLIQNCAWGCTEVFNNSAKNLCLTYPWKISSMHDYWLHLLCAYFGSVVYDVESSIIYRQHETNVVGIRRNSYEHIRNYIKRFNIKGEHPRQEDAKYLLSICNDLSLEEISDINKIAHYNDSLLKKIKLLFDFKIHMTSILGDVAYRIRIIRGVV